MLPGKQDVTDAVQSVKYLLGKAEEPPRYGRFDFRQKLEYWALVWGTILMGVTGIILLFPAFFTSFLPGDFIYAAKAAHGLEALLAVAAIVSWHMYHAHFAQGIFPIDTTIFTGKISVERMMEEHPLEYEAWLAAQEKASRADDTEENEGGKADV
jgi:cytochrome b subunit of formate dehydrogenase